MTSCSSCKRKTLGQRVPPRTVGWTRGRTAERIPLLQPVDERCDRPQQGRQLRPRRIKMFWALRFSTSATMWSRWSRSWEKIPRTVRGSCTTGWPCLGPEMKVLLVSVGPLRVGTRSVLRAQETQPDTWISSGRWKRRGRHRYPRPRRQCVAARLPLRLSRPCSRMHRGMARLIGVTTPISAPDFLDTRDPGIGPVPRSTTVMATTGLSELSTPRPGSSATIRPRRRCPHPPAPTPAGPQNRRPPPGTRRGRPPPRSAPPPRRRPPLPRPPRSWSPGKRRRPAAL
mmetsp:Transcript_20119/g.49356  ORF Transcript_20119/g.49356 Transcript_20119/m.49356 type:complete len:285 (+) Transcript_20119:1468-2322(+)